MKTQTLSLLFSSLVFAQGCGVTGTAYVPRAVALEETPALVMQALHELAGERGWQVVESDAGRLEAVAPAEWVGSAATRERWSFTLTGESLVAERRFEVMFDSSSAWESADVVCATYSYVREEQELSALRGLLAGRLVATAH